MRAVLQRVASASVTVGDRVVGQIGPGLVVLLGVEAGDNDQELAFITDKTAHLRIFEDTAGKMNRSVQDIGGAILVVSQFTLLADCRKGRRPGFTKAAAPEVADRYYQQFADGLRRIGLEVATGTFRAQMQVQLINDGPVTILLDSRKES